jgi:hypothetical protein
MKKATQIVLAALVSISSLAVSAEAAEIAPIEIPPYGMTCKSNDGHAVSIFPIAGREARVDLILSKDGVDLSENTFRVERLDLEEGAVYVFTGWVEMDLSAELLLKDSENMLGARFRFNFDAMHELGFPPELLNCDVI